MCQGLISCADLGVEQVWKELDRPAVFLMDLAPVDVAFLVVCEPKYSDVFVSPSKEYKYSTAKSDTYKHLLPLIGRESILTAEGEDWKVLRKRFNPAFSPKYLHSLVPAIVSLTEIFLARLEEAARSTEVIALGLITEDLTTDVITQLTLETDFQAQRTPEGRGEKGIFGILRASRRISKLTYRSDKALNPLYRLDFTRPLKAMFYEYIFDSRLSKIIESQMQKTLTEKSATSPAKSITQLATTGLPVSNDLVRNTVHQIKTFIFAGQDTTSTLLAYVIYELSRNRSILSKVREEHDSVFGPGACSATEVLREKGAADRILGRHLPYTTAVLKETLRLHPPAATARYLPEGKSFEIEWDGKSIDIAGLRVYPCQWIIHRNTKVWGPDALLFKPERWLDERYMSSLAPGSYRPFEHGPRNCIGQELAMIEGKVVLAMVARAFEFEKVELTGLDGQEELYDIVAVTHKPADAMRMRVRKVGMQGKGI